MLILIGVLVGGLVGVMLIGLFHIILELYQEHGFGAFLLFFFILACAAAGGYLAYLDMYS